MEEALELARAKDTKERMAAVERLYQLLEGSRKTLTSSEVTSLVDCCLDLLKDNNFRVSQGALQALASAAVLSGDHLKLHFNALVPAVVERLGDAKQPVRDAARRLLLTLMEVSSPTIIVERAGSYAWRHKSWRVREEFARTVTSAISLFAATELPLQRAILPPILQMLSDSNLGVRDAAILCIEEMYRQAGTQFRDELHRHQLPGSMVRDINARLEKIQPQVRSLDGNLGGYASGEMKPTNLNPKKSSPRAKSSSRETSLFGGENDIAEKPVDPIKVYSDKELIREFEKISSTLVPEKDWSVRIAAMQRVEGLVFGGATDYPCFRGLLKQLVGTLSQSDVARVSRPNFGDQSQQTEEEMIVPELRRAFSNKKGDVTPMKMLIARKMSKEMVSKHNPHNVIAKLMGLDALPRQPHNLSAQRCYSKGSSENSLSNSDILVEGWEQDQGFADKEMICNVDPCQEVNKYKDVYEIWKQPPMTTYSRDSSPQKGRYKDDVKDKRMALVHQKFMEAKHLVTDEKLRQTKEFQDALEILSSNIELFLKFLEEPNSTLSQHLCNSQSLSPTPEKKRITVLRPKVVDKEKKSGIGSSNKQTKKPAQIGHVTGLDRKNEACYPSFPSPKLDEYPSQPTRIVVLKPSPGKPLAFETMVSPFPSSPRILHGEDFYDEPQDDGAREPREVAKEITRQMRENPMGHRRDETLLSSVFSNGYIGDDSSLNISENEYAVENSDSEVTSPISRRSLDYTNRFSSPFSSSSFSHASYSPESSVCREAKKRISERWAMMASKGNSQEHRHVTRSSSPLGEMLSLSDTKKSMKSEEEGSTKEQKPRGSTSCIASNLNKEEHTNGSPRNLLRSKSVPVSSTAYVERLNVGFMDPEASKEQVPKELTKAKSLKSSFKWKVSSLFFSKNKMNKEKCTESQLTQESPSTTPGTQASAISHPQKINNDASHTADDSCNQVCSSPVLSGSVSKTPLPDLTGREKQCMIAVEGGLSVAKHPMFVNISENQDQPSPISVLEALFDEDENTNPESSRSIKPVHQGLEVPPKSNLIDKSPPIGSIARTLSWDDSCSETATLHSSNPSTDSPGAKEEEQDWVFYVQTLFSAAGLNGEVCIEPFIARWHSPESPLDPSLRYKYANLNDKEPLHEAKRRQRRSNMKLIFDCVNAAIMDITSHGSNSGMRALSSVRVHFRDIESTPPLLVDLVFAQMKEWFSGDSKCLADDDDWDRNSLVVERVVQKEILGKRWVDKMELERDNLRSEIEGKLLQDLLEEAVVDLTGMVF